MNSIGIDDNLNYPRIRKLLTIGLVGSGIAMIGDLILGYGLHGENLQGLAQFFSLYQNISDLRMYLSAILGMFGMILEFLCLFGVYRLMADSSPKFAHAYRSGILGCAITAPFGYHVGTVATFFTYKRLLELSDPGTALEIITNYMSCFVIPAIVLFFIFFLVLTITQIRAFMQEKTPLPKIYGIFSPLVAILVSKICELIGDHAIANAIGTAWLHVGFVFMYAGLLVGVSRLHKK